MHEEKKITKEERLNLLRSIVRLLTVQCGTFDLCVIKHMWFEWDLIQDLDQLFPDTINMFTCRTPRACIKSHALMVKFGTGRRDPPLHCNNAKKEEATYHQTK